MQIHLPLSSLPPLVTRAAAASQWSVGQLLSAEVIGTPRANYTQLRIADAVVTARSAVPLPQGRQLTLRVAALGQTVVLQVVDSPRAPAQAAVDRALARMLPVQASVADAARLLRTIDGIARNGGPDAHASRLLPAPPPALGQRAAGLIRSLPRAPEMEQPARLRAAVEQSARPLEAKLAAITAGAVTVTGEVETDLRWQLLRLGQTLAARAPAPGPASPPSAATASTVPASPSTPAPGQADDSARANRAAPEAREGALPVRDAAPELDVPRLKALVEGAVSRLSAAQVQNLPTHSGAPVGFMIELPLAHERGVDLLQFEYEQEREAASRDDEGIRATVTVNLVMDEEHDLRARIRLSGNALAITVGSTHPGMALLIAEHADSLRQGIEQHGYAVTRLSIGPVTVEQRPRTGARRLVDASV